MLTVNPQNVVQCNRACGNTNGAMLVCVPEPKSMKPRYKPRQKSERRLQNSYTLKPDRQHTHTHIPITIHNKYLPDTDRPLQEEKQHATPHQLGLQMAYLYGEYKQEYCDYAISTHSL